MIRRILRQEEMTLWNSVTHDVIPLKNTFSKERLHNSGKRDSSPQAETMSLPNSALSKDNAFGKALGRSLPVRPKQREVYVGIRNPGLDNTQWRKLAKGKIAIDGRLDLHGYTVQDAFNRLISFMARARAGHWRCVEIITGMGSGEKGGMIRRELPLWLQRPDIAPFILAIIHPHHGNQGAVRVLMKRQRG